MLATLWLIVLVAALGTWIRLDARRYRRFRTITDTVVRRRHYRRWIAESFAVLAGGGAVTLALIGRLDAPIAFPPEFAAMTASLAPPSGDTGDLMSGALIGLGLGLVVSAVILVAKRRLRGAPAARLRTVGDIEPMLPRNAAETALMVPLSLNAGFSEELFFRCALPLLLVSVTGSVVAALALSTVAFGLAHAYQGIVGVVATALVGALLAALYLASGSLWLAMAVHAAIDVGALVVRPTLARLLAGRPGE